PRPAAGRRGALLLLMTGGVVGLALGILLSVGFFATHTFLTHTLPETQEQVQVFNELNELRQEINQLNDEKKLKDQGKGEAKKEEQGPGEGGGEGGGGGRAGGGGRPPGGPPPGRPPPPLSWRRRASRRRPGNPPWSRSSPRSRRAMTPTRTSTKSWSAWRRR